MSSMIPSPPPSISIGGGPGGPGGPSGGPQGGGDGPDSEQVKNLLTQALKLIRQAEDLEGDPADQAKIAKAAADIRGFLGAQQDMMDSVMGGGPGAKVLRKSSAPAGA